MIPLALTEINSNHMTHLSHSKGFTLIELLVVISIIGLLAASIANSFTDIKAGARDAVRLQDMRTIEGALLAFFIENQRFPNISDDGIDTGGETIGVGNPIDAALAPHLPSIPIDPRHDAGTGLRPVAGALYFYSYDPYHYISLEDCLASTAPSSALIGIVFGFNTAEGTMERVIDTCHGGNVNLDNADFNRGLR
jgi:general secretion pathway protein G